MDAAVAAKAGNGLCRAAPASGTHIFSPLRAAGITGPAAEWKGQETEEEKRASTEKEAGMKETVIDLEMLHEIFAPCAEYTGRDVLNKLSQIAVPNETAWGFADLCPHCSYCQTLEDGSLNCRSLNGLNGRVGSGDGCSRGSFRRVYKDN